MSYIQATISTDVLQLIISLPQLPLNKFLQLLTSFQSHIHTIQFSHNRHQS
ncbi:hypothetical protein SLEP1_g37079 [Rubroshorea leprosula]|uniref:Uncharacterized protein n=1 Tax=Rubroshorea leprosula TaxID=152421 RepID=A0AAV5KTI8_9ROSI|nr:hypothetical protein SLEP1_g37079 [Rubroshorea leprosula]